MSSEPVVSRAGRNSLILLGSIFVVGLWIQAAAGMSPIWNADVPPVAIGVATGLLIAGAIAFLRRRLVAREYWERIIALALRKDGDVERWHEAIGLPYVVSGDVVMFGHGPMPPRLGPDTWFSEPPISRRTHPRLLEIDRALSGGRVQIPLHEFLAARSLLEDGDHDGWLAMLTGAILIASDQEDEAEEDVAEAIDVADDISTILRT